MAVNQVEGHTSPHPVTGI